MSALKAGSVVDVATSRGLGTVIITSTSTDTFEGWEVAPRDHTSIMRSYNGHTEEILFPHDGERAFVVPLYEGEIVAFTESDEDGVTIYSPASRPRSVAKTPVVVLNALINALRNADEADIVEQINASREFYLSHIAQVLNIKVK